MRRGRHSIESAPPVVMAMSGMSPSDCLRGSRVWLTSVSAKSEQAVTVGILIWRRHLPTFMMSGMLLPTGTSLRTKLPCVSVSADATADTELPSQRSQLAPDASGGTSPLGTYTTTL